MATQPVPAERIATIVGAYLALPPEQRVSVERAAPLVGVSPMTLRRYLQTDIGKAIVAGIPQPPAPKDPPPPIPVKAEKEVMELAIAKDKIRDLQAALKDVRAASLDTELIKREIIGLTEKAARATAPEWLVRGNLAKGSPGVPTLLASDWHWGEVVNPTEINHRNQFNLAIANTRARRLVERTIGLLRGHVVNPTFPGIVFALGGDMVSGDIHEELSETNDVPIMPTVIDLYGVLCWCIQALADEFGRVFVPCVTGNHGRNTKKMRAKQRAFTNFDWLTYQLLAKHFQYDERITFYIPDGPDALYAIYNHRYLLTHGDQFYGGDGEVGALGPIIRGSKRKQSRNAEIDMSFNTILMGHWHQYIPSMRYIVNGSLKGYDEYANSRNFGFERPIQALWLTHAEHGITFQMPVYLEDNENAGGSENWVSWKEAA